ncbi:phage holin family protein [Aeromonas schubertii]|uniref:Phage holin family protein n=1 Tax=Aeromonas schubertii TaxID=652 RepID=A0ABS7V5P5_9GAMM|nr:phage holin family protein [Aeromonas schubertii]MBZ6064700.1 phage holin family protein [Aeromonas schubertii]
MLTILYTVICLAIALRLATFNRNGGDYRPLPALLAWLLTVAAGSVPLRVLLGTLPPPDPAAVLLAAVVLTALLGSRGSVMRLIPRRHPRPFQRTAADIYRRFQP